MSPSRRRRMLQRFVQVKLRSFAVFFIGYEVCHHQFHQRGTTAFLSCWTCPVIRFNNSFHFRAITNENTRNVFTVLVVIAHGVITFTGDEGALLWLVVPVPRRNAYFLQSVYSGVREVTEINLVFP